MKRFFKLLVKKIAIEFFKKQTLNVNREDIIQKIFGESYDDVLVDSRMFLQQLTQFFRKCN